MNLLAPLENHFPIDYKDERVSQRARDILRQAVTILRRVEHHRRNIIKGECSLEEEEEDLESLIDIVDPPVSFRKYFLSF